MKGISHSSTTRLLKLTTLVVAVASILIVSLAAPARAEMIAKGGTYVIAHVCEIALVYFCVPS